MDVTGQVGRPSRRASTIRRVTAATGRVQERGVVAAFLVLTIALTLTSNKFLQQTNILQVVRQASLIGTMAMAMVFVLAMGDVDLSVGSIVGLVNLGTAVLMRSGVPLELSLLAGLMIGAVSGLINGVVSVAMRIPLIIVTLGTLSVYRGLALVMSDSRQISNFPQNNWFFTVVGGNVLGVPTSIIVMLIAGVMLFVLFNNTAFGRHVQAIGSNRQAARFSGVHIDRTRIIVMTLMGLFAAVSGLLSLAWLASADPSTGVGQELAVIAAAIIGGTALTGGSGSIPGGILGALITVIIRNGLVLLGFGVFWGQVVTGVVVIAAVGIDSFIRRRR